MEPYLCLDPVESPEPEDLASAELPLGMVNLFFPLGQLLVSHLVFPRPVPCFLQALKLASGNGGDDLRGQRRGTTGRGGHQSSTGLIRMVVLLGPRGGPEGTQTAHLPLTMSETSVRVSPHLELDIPSLSLRLHNWATFACCQIHSPEAETAFFLWRALFPVFNQRKQTQRSPWGAECGVLPREGAVIWLDARAIGWEVQVGLQHASMHAYGSSLFSLSHPESQRSMWCNLLT